MKKYKFINPSTVLVNGEPLTLKRRLNEPEQPPNPDRIGFSILADCVGESAALLHCRDFQQEIVNYCEAGEEISSDEVIEWNDYMCGVGASVQSAVRTINGTEPTAMGGGYLHLPRLLRVQKQSPSSSKRS